MLEVQSATGRGMLHPQIKVRAFCSLCSANNQDDVHKSVSSISVMPLCKKILGVLYLNTLPPVEHKKTDEIEIIKNYVILTVCIRRF